jgi:hypothetical protein
MGCSDFSCRFCNCNRQWSFYAGIYNAISCSEVFIRWKTLWNTSYRTSALANTVRTSALRGTFLLFLSCSPQTGAPNGMVCGGFSAVLWISIFRIMSFVWSVLFPRTAKAVSKQVVVCKLVPRPSTLKFLVEINSIIRAFSDGLSSWMYRNFMSYELQELFGCFFFPWCSFIAYTNLLQS